MYMSVFKVLSQFHTHSCYYVVGIYTLLFMISCQWGDVCWCPPAGPSICYAKSPWPFDSICSHRSMMRSWHGNAFCITGPLWGESTGDRWIPITKTSDVEPWFFPCWSMNRLLNKQSRGRWTVMSWHSLYVAVMFGQHFQCHAINCINVDVFD